MQKNNNMTIRQALLYRGYSQVELAKILNIDPPNLSRMLSLELAEEEQKRIAEMIMEAKL